jgi:hypothetical protein
VAAGSRGRHLAWVIERSIMTVFTPAATSARPAVGQTRARRAHISFRRFRRTRPFWGCLVLALGGYFVLAPVVSSTSMTMQLGVGGVSGYILGGGMIAAAGVAVVMPQQRHFPAIMAMIFSVASLPLANLGGWLIGMLFGIIGSGLVFAWAPFTDEQLARIAARAQRRAERRTRGRRSPTTT